MRGDHISRTQLMALLWAGVMAPAAQLLPGLLLDRAGRGAWLAAALTAPLVLAAGWLWGALAGREGPALAICRLLGRWPGRALLLIYMVWGQVLLTLRLRACAHPVADHHENRAVKLLYSHAVARFLTPKFCAARGSDLHVKIVAAAPLAFRRSLQYSRHRSKLPSREANRLFVGRNGLLLLIQSCKLFYHLRSHVKTVPHVLKRPRAHASNLRSEVPQEVEPAHYALVCNNGNCLTPQFRKRAKLAPQVESQLSASYDATRGIMLGEQRSVEEL